MTIINLATSPEIKRVILAADPTYRKKKAIVHVYDSVSLSGTYWDGGSRSKYTAVNIATGQSQGAPQYDPPQFGGPAVAPEVTIPDGIAIVETGVFCGKTATASVFVNSRTALI